jgi:hypothetical protein
MLCPCSSFAAWTANRSKAVKGSRLWCPFTVTCSSQAASSGRRWTPVADGCRCSWRTWSCARAFSVAWVAQCTTPAGTCTLGVWITQNPREWSCSVTAQFSAAYQAEMVLATSLHITSSASLTGMLLAWKHRCTTSTAGCGRTSRCMPRHELAQPESGL